MKTQVVVIHGGDSFATYDEYIADLKQATLDLHRTSGWKSSLPETLGEEFEVIAPHMPNAQNAKFIEWEIWFGKLIPHLTDGVILLGHSLGASFLAKYLSTKPFPKKIKATFLVAPPYDTDTGRKLVEFDITNSLDLLAKQGGDIYLYHSTDDPIVAFSELAKFQKALPKATVRTFEDRGHFIDETFPELIEDLKSLVN